MFVQDLVLFIFLSLFTHLAVAIPVPIPADVVQTGIVYYNEGDIFVHPEHHQALIITKVITPGMAYEAMPCSLFYDKHLGHLPLADYLIPGSPFASYFAFTGGIEKPTLAQLWVATRFQDMFERNPVDKFEQFKIKAAEIWSKTGLIAGPNRTPFQILPATHPLMKYPPFADYMSFPELGTMPEPVMPFYNEGEIFVNPNSHLSLIIVKVVTPGSTYEVMSCSLLDGKQEVEGCISLAKYLTPGSPFAEYYAFTGIKEVTVKQLSLGRRYQSDFIRNRDDDKFKQFMTNAKEIRSKIGRTAGPSNAPSQNPHAPPSAKPPQKRPPPQDSAT